MVTDAFASDEEAPAESSSKPEQELLRLNLICSRYPSVCGEARVENVSDVAELNRIAAGIKYNSTLGADVNQDKWWEDMTVLGFRKCFYELSTHRADILEIHPRFNAAS
jgi:hypothetical protein